MTYYYTRELHLAASHDTSQAQSHEEDIALIRKASELVNNLNIPRRS